MKRILAAVATLAGISGCYGTTYVEPSGSYQTTTEYAPYDKAAAWDEGYAAATADRYPPITGGLLKMGCLANPRHPEGACTCFYMLGGSR